MVSGFQAKLDRETADAKARLDAVVVPKMPESEFADILVKINSRFGMITRSMRPFPTVPFILNWSGYRDLTVIHQKIQGLKAQIAARTANYQELTNLLKETESLLKQHEGTERYALIKQQQDEILNFNKEEKRLKTIFDSHFKVLTDGFDKESVKREVGRINMMSLDLGPSSKSSDPDLADLQRKVEALKKK